MHEPCRDEHLIAGAAFPRKTELVIHLADIRRSRLAEGAPAARDDALGHAAIRGLDVLDPGADRLDRSRPLVAERQGIAHKREIDLSAEELEVGAAHAAVGGSDYDLTGARLESRPFPDPDRPRLLYHERAPRHREKLCQRVGSDGPIEQ